MDYVEIYDRLDNARENFWSKVEKTDHCWNWTTTLNKGGYGVFALQEKRLAAHRVSYQLHHGHHITNEDFICHKCDNPKCVNPDHLFIGDHQLNMNDMIGKNRHHNQLKTACPRGHEYTDENTYINKRGSRVCRVCSKLGRKGILHSGMEDEITKMINGYEESCPVSYEELRKIVGATIRWARANPRS